jgi:xylulokinase
MEERTAAHDASRGRSRSHGSSAFGHSRSPAVIGLDIGTSSVKGILAGESGVLASGRRRYRLDIGADGRVELDADSVWRAVRSVIRSFVATSRDHGHAVVAVCCGGSGDEAVWLDADDRPVALIPMALDRRSDADGRALVEAVGLAAFMETTGLPLSGSYPLARLAWLARTVPATASRVRRLLAWPEFVALRLGVEPLAEPTLAARSAAYDVGQAQWDRRLVDAAGVGSSPFPRLGGSGGIAGTIPAAVAARLGLGRGVAVVAGGFDQAMATRGAGVVGPGAAHLGTGSWEAVTVLADLPRFDLVKRGFSVGPSIDAGASWSVMMSWPGAARLSWLAGFGSLLPRSRGTSDADVKRALTQARRGPDTPTGVLTTAGVLAGLRLDVDAGTLIRAVLEGIAFDAADALDDLANTGLSIHEVRITGGGAADPRWVQLRADVLGVPIVAVQPWDAGVSAAAALAWTAAVGDAAVETVLARLVRHDPLVAPRRDRNAAYAELRARRTVLKQALDGHADETLGIGR